MAMSQSTKVIDVTRSFIPVNPNAYPENLHSTGQEDSPERSPPIVPYKGENFLPTAYGYKSFFGMNAAIQALALERDVDHLFIFQTATYKNILFALCDNGVWISVPPEPIDEEALLPPDNIWVNLVGMDVAADDEYFEYSFFVIKNKLYVYRQNGTQFYQFETDPDEEYGILMTTFVPDFITLTSQLGMFRARNRIGFWDGENAISWSSPDDYNDFTPAVLTGANVTTFNSILGKISAIRPHGDHCICYASKSITLLQINPAETFFMKAIPIIEAGVPYKRQSVENVPDTEHFAYTDAGIYKIKSGAEERIIPEVWDYFKELTQQPIYLHLLQSRYLAFECIDPNAINGIPQFSKVIIPPSTVTFPGVPPTLEAVNESDPDDIAICDVVDLLDDNYFQEQKDDGDAAVPINNRKPGTFMQPVYTCYLSNNGQSNLTELEWDMNPCGQVGPTGKELKMAPVPTLGDLSKMTQTTVNKTVVPATDAYLDGKWTMERFVATQMALWEQQDKGIDEFLSKVASRSESDSTITPNSNTCVLSVPAYSTCVIGKFAKAYSAPKFGFNKCSFWLTRYVVEAVEAQTKYRQTIRCNDPYTAVTPSLFHVTYPGNPALYPGLFYGSIAAAVAGAPNYGSSTSHTYAPLADGAAVTYATLDGGATGEAGYGRLNNQLGVHAWDIAIYYAASDAMHTLHKVSDGLYPDYPVIQQHYAPGYADLALTVEAYNVLEPLDQAPTPETAFCLLTHWKYTNTAGETVTVPATTCTETADKYPGFSGLAPDDRTVDEDDPRPPVLMGSDGSFCNIPFDPPIVPGDVSWPDETVEYEGGSFLLQNGSIAPKYPTFTGFLVYDLALKKWGKMVGEYKVLLDYSPMNSSSSSALDFNIFGILAGAMKANGKIYVFDSAPASSFLTWGKIGYYRLGMTDPQSIRVDFKTMSTGTLEVDSSLDGINLGIELHFEQAFTSTNQVVAYPTYSAKWHNITVRGKFDISYLEFIGLQKGKR